MSWNHRVVKKLGLYQIHEAFYRKKKNKVPYAWTESGVAPMGDTVEELREVLIQMLSATYNDVIDGDEDE